MGLHFSVSCVFFNHANMVLLTSHLIFKYFSVCGEAGWSIQRVHYFLAELYSPLGLVVILVNSA